MNSTIVYLRAFIAYCEGRSPNHTPFALIPYDEAISAGIPFSETFIFENNNWAVWIAGDVAPWELIALEKAGVIDPQI